MSDLPSEISIDDLLAHAGRIRKLARSLVFDQQNVDDVVQQTWLVVLRDRPQGVRSISSWLGGVVFNTARHQRRSEERHRRPSSELVVDATVPSTAEMVEHAELQRELVATVLRLEEPYLSTVLLRFFQGRSAAEISQIQGTPAGTVRSRLKRALDQLREQLDQAHDGDRRAWSLNLIPLVLAGDPAKVGAAVGGGSTVLASVLAMGLWAKLVIVGVVLALGATAWLLWSPQDAGSTVPEIEPTDVASATSGDSNSGSDSAVPGSEPSTERTAVSIDSSHTDGAPVEQTDQTEGFEVLVQHAGTGEPVPNASVQCIPFNDESTVLAIMPMFGGVDFDALFSAHGQSYPADGDGRVRVPKFLLGALLSASHDGMWGLCNPKAGEDPPFVIELHPDPPLHVLVVDGSGAGVPGVPVEIRTRQGPFAQTVIPSRKTGSDGCVDIPHVAHIEISGEDVSLLVVASVPLASPVQERLDPRSISADAVELVIPETGRLEVVARCADGQPPGPGALVALLVDEERPGVDPEVPFFYLGASTQALDQNGRSQFDHVGLNLPLTVQIYGMQGEKPAVRTIAGPTVQGETVTITITLADLHPILTGLVVHEDGTPSARSYFRITLEQREGTSRFTSYRRLHTDKDGRFRLVELEEDVAAGAQRTLTLEFMGDDERGPSWGEADVPLLLSPGENDLGSIVLRPTPLIASGIVVNEANEPLQGAEVTVLVPEQRGKTVHWDQLGDVRETTAERGLFSLFGRAQSEVVGIRAERPGYLRSDLLECAPGSKELVLVLRESARIPGTVLLDPDVPPDAIVVRARQSDELADLGQELDCVPTRSGDFAIEGCAPGEWFVQIALVGTGEVVAEFMGVQAGGAGHQGDPRLRKIDLRGRLCAVVLTVEDTQGTPISDPEVVCLDESAPLREVGEVRGLNRNKIRLVTQNAALDLQVCAPGFRFARIRDLREDLTVVLDRGVPVRVVLADSAVLPGEDLNLQASVRLHEGAGSRVENEELFSEKGQVELFLPGPGVYRLQLYLEWHDSSSSTAHSINHEPILFDVQDDGGQQTIRVNPSAAAIQRSVRSVRR